MEKHLGSYLESELDKLPPMLTPTQTAKVLGLTRCCVINYIARNIMPGISVKPKDSGQKLYRIPKTELIEYLRNCQ